LSIPFITPLNKANCRILAESICCCLRIAGNQKYSGANRSGASVRVLEYAKYRQAAGFLRASLRLDPSSAFTVIWPYSITFQAIAAPPEVFDEAAIFIL
jgi:hypothetical protein